MRAETASAREALQWRIAVCVLWLSIGLYLFSLSGIAVCLDPGECQRGWVALAFGWVGVSRVEDLAWFANPLLIFGWLLAPSGARFLSGPFCVAPLLISGAFLFATKVVGPGEGGFREADLVSIGSGYWLWLASIAMAVVAAMLFPRSKLQWP